MPFNDLSLDELQRLARVEKDAERLLELMQEITERNKQRDRDITFEIFSGIPDRDAVWMTTVIGLVPANERMVKMAAESPGPYFIFHKPSRKVMARLNNRVKENRESPKTGSY